MKSRKINIENIDQAREVVQQFEQKVDAMYASLDSENEEKNNNIAKMLNSHDSSVTELAAKLQDKDYQASDEYIKLLRSIKKLQNAWREKRSKDTVRLFNSNGYHHHEVNTLTNKQEIQINLNADKQTSLYKAYKNQDWDNEIFSDPLLLETALGLFANGRLKSAEFETLLIMKYAKTPLNHPDVDQTEYKLKSFRVLDDNHQFTKEANKLLIPNLPGHMKQPFDQVQINNLQLIAQAYFELYPAENVCFTVESSEFDKDALACQLTKYGLATTIYIGEVPKEPSPLLSLLSQNKNQKKYVKLIKSCTMESILKLACFSVLDVAPVRSLAGNLPTMDVERGVTVHLRPGAVTFPNVPQNPDIHKYTIVSASTRRDHDCYHAEMMTRIGYALCRIFLYIKDLSRNQILSHGPQFKNIPYLERNSAVTWKLNDLEFSLFNVSEEKLATLGISEKIIEQATTVEKFICSLNYAKKSPILFMDSDKPTDLGILTFINMAIDRDIWKEMDCDPELLYDKYKIQFDIANELLPYFKENDPKYNLVIFKAYTLLGKESFPNFLTYLEENKHILDGIEFHRNNMIKFIGLRDKTTRKQLSDVLAFVLYRPIEKITIHKDFNINDYQNLFKELLLLTIHFKHYKFLREKVLNPIREIVMQVMQTNDMDLFRNMKMAIQEFNKFADYHSKKTDSPIKNELSILLDLYKNLNQFYISNRGMQGGFLNKQV